MSAPLPSLAAFAARRPDASRCHIVAATLKSQDDAPTAVASAASAFGMASIGRHALLYAIGNILSKAVAFLMLPIYTRFLSPADYGIAALIEMTLEVVGILAGVQVAQGIFRFYHKADSEADRRAVVSTALTTLMISFGIAGALAFSGAAALSTLVFETPAHANLVRLSSVSFFLQSFILVPLAFARVQERSALVVGATLVKLLIALILNLVFLVVMKLGVRGVFLSTLGANLIVALWLGWSTIRQVGVRIRPDVLRSLVRYGVPLIGVQAATFTMTFSDRYFLQAAGGQTVVGLYNLAYQFGFLLLMLGFVPIEMIWGPRRFQVARGPDAQPLLSKAFRIVNVSVTSIGVGIALFVEDLLRIMATPPFHPAAAVVPVILVAYVFHGWAMMHDIGVLVKERTEFLTIANWVAAVVALGAFALLVPRYYAFGAAVGAVLAFSVRWGMTYYFSQRLWPVRYDWLPVFKVLSIGVVMIAIGIALPRMPLRVSIPTHLALLGAYAVGVWNAAILTVDEKQWAARHVHRLLDLLRRRGTATDASRASS